MNIFFLSEDVNESAKWTIDRHIVKMILETAQLLSTAHRLLDGVEYIDSSSGRKIKRWKLNDEREKILYKATHMSHPCAQWARETESNYNWLYLLLLAYLKEYTYRYDKIHKIEREGLSIYLGKTPKNIPNGDRTKMPSAMDKTYIISDDPIVNYKYYYTNAKRYDKNGKFMHIWSKRDVPDWIQQYADMFVWRN